MLMLSALAVPTIGIASPIIIRYESEVHTGNSYVAFYNSVISGANITQIILYLGSNTIFDTNGSGLDGLATFPLKIPKAGTDESAQSGQLFPGAEEGVGSGNRS
jgi:hypothetical protein